MRRRRRTGSVSARSAFAGFQFPSEVITLAVRWYLRYGLAYRDVEELLAERGSRSTTSRSIDGCSDSLRCSLTPPGRAAAPPVTAGSSMRPK
jgi:transposase-like protein